MYKQAIILGPPSLHTLEGIPFLPGTFLSWTEQLADISLSMSGGLSGSGTTGLCTKKEAKTLLHEQ